jgi:hypothetical protein
MTPEMQTLCNSLSCITYQGNKHTHILIEENDRLALLKKVTLLAPNGDWFAFAPDKGRGKTALMSPLLATEAQHDHHRACDCVVVVNSNGQLTIVYLDLKSGNPIGYSGQFKSTRQFVRYALGLHEEFHKRKLAIVAERYVILYGGKPALFNKTTTVPKTEKIRKSRPDAAYKREVHNSARLYLKELLD